MGNTQVHSEFHPLLVKALAPYVELVDSFLVSFVVGFVDICSMSLSLSVLPLIP